MPRSTYRLAASAVPGANRLQRTDSTRVSANLHCDQYVAVKSVPSGSFVAATTLPAENTRATNPSRTTEPSRRTQPDSATETPAARTDSLRFKKISPTARLSTRKSRDTEVEFDTFTARRDHRSPASRARTGARAPRTCRRCPCSCRPRTPPADGRPPDPGRTRCAPGGRRSRRDRARMAGRRRCCRRGGRPDGLAVVFVLVAPRLAGRPEVAFEVERRDLVRPRRSAPKEGSLISLTSTTLPPTTKRNGCRCRAV